MLFGEGSQAKRIPKAEVKNTLAFCVSVSFAVAASIIQHTTAGSTTDQSFVYHLKLVISRLPSQIPWWEQPSVTFRYLLHTIAIASALFHWTYTGTCQTNRLTTILLCVSQCYYRLTTADPFFQTHQLKCQHCDNFVGLRFC